MNTAATLWCTAAVGTLAGLGRYEFAALGALGVLSANVILRPVAHLIYRAPAQKENHEIIDRLRCTCRTATGNSRGRACMSNNSLEWFGNLACSGKFTGQKAGAAHRLCCCLWSNVRLELALNTVHLTILICLTKSMRRVRCRFRGRKG